MSGAGLVLIGSGGFGRETAAAARDGGFDGEVHGFLDDNPDRAGAMLAGLPVLGPLEVLAEFPDALVVITTGRPDNYTSRAAIVTRLGLPSSRYGTVVHPRASLAPDTEVGPGSVVLAGAVATTGVRIGSHVAVMPQVLLTHDDSVEDFATLAGGVSLAGNVHVGMGAYVGAGALVRQGLKLGAWSMIGMGSLVLEDVPDRRLWFGTPAGDRGPSPAAEFRWPRASGAAQAAEGRP
jgi:sugar O-acyltransferase (sialic acid O-acetyltransferase NeuD family)